MREGALRSTLHPVGVLPRPKDPSALARLRLPFPGQRGRLLAGGRAQFRSPDRGKLAGRPAVSRACSWIDGRADQASSSPRRGRARNGAQASSWRQNGRNRVSRVPPGYETASLSEILSSCCETRQFLATLNSENEGCPQAPLRRRRSAGPAVSLPAFRRAARPAGDSPDRNQRGAHRAPNRAGVFFLKSVVAGGSCRNGSAATTWTSASACCSTLARAGERPLRLDAGREPARAVPPRVLPLARPGRRLGPRRRRRPPRASRAHPLPRLPDLRVVHYFFAGAAALRRHSGVVGDEEPASP